MSIEIKPEMVFDIFNVPRDGTNIADDDEEMLVEDSDVQKVMSFDDKAAEIAKEIEKLPPSPALEVKTMAADDVEKPLKEVKKNKFAALFDEEPPAKVPPPKEPPPTVQTVQRGIGAKAEKTVETQDDGSAEAAAFDKAMEKDFPPREPVKINITAPLKIEEPKREAPQIQGASGRWLLMSPAPKYNKFYEEKASTLSNYLLKGGEIPFDQYYSELEDANVNTNVSTYDTEEIGRRISEVQKWRDRVKHIQLHANKQYFVWKMYMDLLPGVLARIEYERGKQEGLVYEHMRDMTGYFGGLEGLHKSCEAVSKHLDGAYNSLSRQAAIAQPLQEVERYTQAARPMTPQQSRYDSLQTHANTGARVSTSPKEAGKPAEPQSGWGVIE